MGLDKLQAMSEAYMNDINKTVENIVSDKINIDEIEFDKKENTLNELIKRNADIYGLHQENTIKTNLLINAIIKGIQQGEDIYYLFLKAIECIGLTTGDGALYNVCKGHLEVVYGYGGINDTPLKIKLQEVETRLHNLILARESETDENVLKRIDNAIKSHEGLIKKLNKSIF